MLRAIDRHRPETSKEVIEDDPSPTPEGVEGGMWIQFEEHDERLVNVTIDEKAQAEARGRIGWKMEELRKRGRRKG
jgi:aromatic ring-opening dioxygenase catalytic subunit (LigB family)